MYGERTWSSMSPSIEMYRAVAKIQVRMGESVADVTPNFNAETVEFAVANYANTGIIQQSSMGTITSGNAQTGASPVYSPFFKLMQKSGATENQTNVYIYEYKSSTLKGLGGGAIANNKTFDRDRQFVLVKKTLNSVSRYYRLDFYNPIDTTFFDTERNHHYIFTINKVRSEGYESQTEAYYNAGSNIEYTVRDSSSTSITSNGQYAILSNVDTIGVYPAASAQMVANVRVIDPTGKLVSVPTADLVNKAWFTSSGTTTGTNITLNAPINRP